MLRFFVLCLIATAPLSAMAADAEPDPADQSSSAGTTSSHTESVQDIPPLQSGVNIIALRRGVQVSNEGRSNGPKPECRTGVVGGGFCVLN